MHEANTTRKSAPLGAIREGKEAMKTLEPKLSTPRKLALARAALEGEKRTIFY